MQAGPEKPPLGIVFDANLGHTIDSVLALALLHGFAGKQQCRVASLTINCPDLRAAQLCDVIERFYASATGPGLGGFVPAPAPIGITEGHKPAPTTFPVLAKVWESKIAQWNDTAIPELLIRNSLMATYDGDAAMVLTGPATNLLALLKLYDILPLIAAKVRLLSIAGNEFTADLPAARRVLEEWPTPIVFCSPEVGEQLPFPGASIDTAFSYNPTHPIAAAYKAAKAMPYDANGQALAATLYAIKAKPDYFTLSEPGTFSLNAAGKVDFKPTAQGKHRWLKADPAKKDEVTRLYTDMAGAKPVAPPPRRLPPQVQKELDEQDQKAKQKAQQK